MPSPIFNWLQTLQFLSTGDLLYASPSLQAYAVLFWIQCTVQPSAVTSVLALKTEGKEALRIVYWRGTVSATVCDVCGQRSVQSTASTVEAYKWAHIGVSINSATRIFTVTVTHWKAVAVHTSQQQDFLLLLYDSQTSIVSIGGFTVSPT